MGFDKSEGLIFIGFDNLCTTGRQGRVGYMYRTGGHGRVRTCCRIDDKSTGE